jgi:hypothetical protein
MTMTKAINQNNFAGQQRVTCATCHNGHIAEGGLLVLGSLREK